MLKLAHPYRTEQVIAALQAANPSKKQTYNKSLRIWEKYVRLMTYAIRKSIFLAPDYLIEQDYLAIEWKKLNRRLGHCRRFEYLTWFHENFPLVDIVRKGTTGELTVIEMKYNLELETKDFLTAKESSSNEECFKNIYGEYFPIILQWIDSGLADPNVDWVSLNRLSLESYILANLAEQAKANNQQHLKTLQHNMCMALDLWQCASYCEQGELGFGIPQIVSESAYGRRYYRGLNLQNISKVVRHAALGRCYQYDLDASVFAWQYHQVKQIDPSFSAPATLEYLDHKSSIRRRLAKELKISTSFQYRLDRIKEIITAIGFGAPSHIEDHYWLKNNRWEQPAIQSIIKSPQARRELLSDPWLKEFIKEQQLMRRMIVNANRSTLEKLHFLYQADRLQINKALSYLYQQDERTTIERLIRASRQRGDFLLLVHDGFYTSQAQKIIEIKELLQAINPWANISMEKHKPYTFHDDSAHKTLIQEMEKRAHAGYIPQEILINYQRIQNHSYIYNQYKAKDEYDDGCRLTSEYDPELDPFNQ